MSVMRLPRIRGTPISCGVHYYNNLSIKGFKASVGDTKKGPKPQPPTTTWYWGDIGHEQNRRDWDRYYREIEKWEDRVAFERGYTYIFSDAYDGNCQGNKIAAYIRKHKLGRIISTGRGVNPNSGNRIETWIWRYNGKRVQSNAAKTSK
jgi:hypothetical protein